MRLIDTGAQFKVFDMHSGRVKKLPLTPEESRVVVKSWYPSGAVPAKALALDYCQTAATACKQVGQLLGQYPELAGSFGNPAFEADNVYTQDKVQPLGMALKLSSIAEGKKLIDDFARLIMHHWQYGLSECVFNCTINNGVNKQGQIILLDFGEVTFDKQRVKASIVAKRWLHCYSYRKGIPEALKVYYNKTLTKQLTVEKLDKLWGVSL